MRIVNYVIIFGKHLGDFMIRSFHTVENFSDRIALIRGPVFRGVLEETYRVANSVFAALLEAWKFAKKGAALLFRCALFISAIPGYAKRALFSGEVSLPKHSEAKEHALCQMLNQMIKKPLNEAEKKLVHAAVEGSLPVEEEIRLRDDIFHRIIEGGDLDRAREVWDRFLKAAKEAFSRERFVSLSPLDRIKERQFVEKEILSRLEKKLKQIDPASLHDRVRDPSEAFYLDSRSEFIRAERPGLDITHLWERCSDVALDSAQFEQLAQEIEALEIVRGTRSDRLLESEYLFLLKQRLALSCDTAKWESKRGVIRELNETTLGTIENIRRAKEERFRRFPHLLERLDIEELHREELEFLKRDPYQIPEYFLQSGGDSLKELERHVHAAIDVEDRLTLLSIKTPKQRNEERQVALAKECLVACLEKTANGQQLISLMQRESRSSIEAELIDSSKRVLKDLFEKNKRVLLDHVYSTSEFVADLGGGEFGTLRFARQEKREHDFGALSKKLDLQLKRWYPALQEIWVKQVSLDQETEILALKGRAREEKMAQLFSQWVLEKTSLPFDRPISFEYVTLPNEREKRAVALERLREALPLEKLREKLHRPLLEAPIQQIFSGVSFRSIQLNQPLHRVAEIEFAPVAAEDEELLVLDPANLVEALKQAPFYNPIGELEARIDWAMSAVYQPPGLKTDFLSAYAAFFDISRAVMDQVTPQFLNGFMHLIQNSDVDPLKKDNFWRREVLACYLRLIFAGRADPIKVTEEQKKYLIQFATLAEFVLPELLVTEEATTFESVQIEVVAERLQSSEIGLEGLDEATIERSFQESTLASNLELRKYIDALRARHGEKLPKELFDAIFDHYSLDHDQGQEGIARAIHHAFQGIDRDEIIAYFQDHFLAQVPQEAIDPQNMILPKKIFFIDCLIALCRSNLLGLDDLMAEVEAFDNQLIKSSNAPCMLMGFSRKIERLSLLFIQNPSAEIFAELLRLKIAYRALRAEHYDGKVEITGFLKVATDRADSAMASSLFQVKDAVQTFDMNEIVRLLHKTESDDPSEKTFAEKAIEKIFKSQREALLPVIFSEPFFISFGRYDIDIVSGCVYFDGMERIELPPYLQNHPYVRELHLHELPYIRAPDGSYSHYTLEGDEAVPQVHISLSATGDLVIRRRLQTNFAPPEAIEFLQYLPISQFAKIPTSLAQRMGAKEFWINAEDHTLYGYSEKGEIVFSLDNEETIKTKLGTFRFVNPLEPSENPQIHLVLANLMNALPQDEILLREDKNLFWIPCLDLTVSLKSDGSALCSSPSISGWVLDLNHTLSPSILALKREGKEKPVRKLEDELILLKKHLREKEAIVGPSTLVKADMVEIRKQVVETEIKLAQVNPRMYLAILPEERDASQLRGGLRNGVTALVQTSLQIAQTENPQESQTLQAQYLAQESDYKDIVAEYKAYCQIKRKPAFLESLRGDSLQARDLRSLLFLLEQSLARGEGVDSVAWIKEIGKFPFSEALSLDTLQFLDRLKIHPDLNQNELSLYLKLMNCQNLFFQIQKTAKEMRVDRDQKLGELSHAYGESLQRCQETFQSLQGEGKILPVEIQSLLHTYLPGILIPQPLIEGEIQEISPLVAASLEGYAVQSLMERLRLTEHVGFLPKDVSRDIPLAQRNLLRAFSAHSGDQVAGFYLEEFGMFSLPTLYKELGLNHETGMALFGLTKEDINGIFLALKDKRWVETRGATDFYYSITARGSNPLSLIQTENIFAFLAHTALAQEDRIRVAQRLRAFFFGAAQSSFSFSWKNPELEGSAKSALLEEQTKHEREMLNAETLLKKILSEGGLTLVELKRKVLIGDHSFEKFSAARNALIRYLFHKTEVQHITNILRAPIKGERNQVELLSTARQYTIESLFKAERSDDQIMQLAFLLFEEDYGARCNASQIKLFKSIMSNPESPEAIDAMQARMGFGKTALLPLMALVQIAKEASLDPRDKSLVRYVVPKAVLQDNASAFGERISHILGTNVLKDREFSRYQIDAKNRIGSFRWILGDLQTRLAIYQQAKDHGIPIIQWPEIRQSMESQELAFGFLVTGGTLGDEEKVLCMQCKQLLGKIRSLQTYTIFDELDATQDFKACEVNFTEGEKLRIDPATIEPLTKLIACVATNQARSVEEWAPLMIQFLGLPRDPAIVNYVSRRELALDTIEIYEDPQDRINIFLIRAILLDPNIFAFVSNKQPSTHFGVRFSEREGKRVYSQDPESGSALLIAVPYEGTNTPKGLSTFDNTEVAAIATLRYYASRETVFEKEPHLQFLITQTQKQAIPPFLETVVHNVVGAGGKSFIERLKQIAELLDQAEIELAKQKFYEEFLSNPRDEVRFYFGRAVVATQVRTDEARANSNRYEMGSLKDQIKGCSGTVSSTSSYFTSPAIDPAADGKLSLEIMGRENNAPISILRPFPDDGTDYLGHVLDSLLEHAKVETRAIIDAAGICKSRDGNPETIVQVLWEKLQYHGQISGIEGIVYYGRDNIKRLYRGPYHPPIPCTTAMELASLPGKKYFSFYGQKNTRGSDIKQADGAHALVTMDENVPNNDAKQAVLRFRSLVQRSSDQKFTFALTARFAEMLLPRGRAERIDAKNVSLYLRLRELEQEQHDALTLFRKELQAHVKQAAAYIEHKIFCDLDLNDTGVQASYEEFLNARDRIIPLVDRALRDLDSKYGNALTTKARDQFIEEEVLRHTRKLRELGELGKRYGTGFNLKFFYKRIQDSRSLFESRYPEDKEVKVAAVDSGAEAIAMALAEAQAEAVAEALAERISEVVVHTQERMYVPSVNMSRAPHFVIQTDWLQNPVGAPVEIYPAMKHLIHPTLRDQIVVSPHLQNETIVSHFALIPLDAAKPHIFVSQEEGDAFLRQWPSFVGADYRLIDLRKDDVTQFSLLVVHMKAAVLQLEEQMPSIVSTEDLRGARLLNVQSEQFLPKLLLEGVDFTEISQRVDLTQFGISKEAERVGFNLRKEGDRLHIDAVALDGRGLRESITLPVMNRWLCPILRDIYGDLVPNKLERMQVRLERDSEAFRRELAELERQERVLAEKKEGLNRLLQDASAFTITPIMREGLVERDNEFITGGRAGAPAEIARCGEAFLTAMARIQGAQEQLRLQPDSARDNLLILRDNFNRFVSEEMQNFSHDFSSVPAFTEDDWNLGSTTRPPFDRVYGRILFSVHKGKIQGEYGAKDCSRRDCNQMFNVILPHLKQTVASMQRAILELPDVLNEIERIQAAIATLVAQKVSLEEAEQTLKAMERSQITAVALSCGIHFEPNEGGAASPQFWDRFRFQDLDTWPDFNLEARLEGELPDYSRNFVERSMREYHRRIRALNSKEIAIRTTHTAFSNTVLRFARQIESRPLEIKIIGT